MSRRKRLQSYINSWYPLRFIQKSKRSFALPYKILHTGYRLNFVLLKIKVIKGNLGPQDSPQPFHISPTIL